MRTLAVADLGECGLEPVRVAARIASGPGHELIVVGIPEPGVVGYSIPSASGPGALMLPSSAVLPAPADELRDAIRAVAEAVGITPRIAIEEGRPRRVVERVVEAAEPDLIVVPGIVPGGRLQALVYGDPWRDVVAASRVPIVLARPGTASAMTILLVLEDPRASADAVRALLCLPLPPDCRVVILGLLSAGLDEGRTRQRRRLVRRIDASRSMLRRAAIETSALVREQASVEEVIAVARRSEAALVVAAVTARGRGRRVHGLAAQLMARCHTSVMVVPTLTAGHRRPSRNHGSALDRQSRRSAGRETVR